MQDEREVVEPLNACSPDCREAADSPGSERGLPDTKKVGQLGLRETENFLDFHELRCQRFGHSRRHGLIVAASIGYCKCPIVIEEAMLRLIAESVVPTLMLRPPAVVIPRR
jgi:hypothetical protein